jgi:hypothetical protein
MKSSIKLAFLLGLLATAGGCKKLDLVPTNDFTDLNFYTTTVNVNNALNNIYSGMYTSDLYFYNDAMSDNAYTSQGASYGNVDVVAAGTFTSSLPKFINDWSFYYSGIKACNLFLEGVAQNHTLGDSLANRMKAEVRFIRALHHFNLMKWWGDVSLLATDITADQAKVISRTSRDSVLNFVTSELEAVAAILPSKDQYAATDNGRITKGAALALEARVLLYEGNRMQDVVNICGKLMNNPSVYGQYSLATSYGGLFSDPVVNKTNPETMLALQYVSGVAGRTWEDAWDFIPISAGGRTNNLAPTQELVNDYVMTNGLPITDPGSGYDENNPYTGRDPRLTATIVYDQYKWLNPDGSTQIIYIKPGTDPNPSALNQYTPGNQTTSASGYYWRKYFDPNALPNQVSGLNLQLIRWAEVLLDYAEAKNSLGQMDATTWSNTIQLLRQRAGFTDPNALNYPGNADMTNIIMRERRAELCMEGTRTEDIRRWKLSQTVLNGYAHGARYGDPTVDSGYIRVQQRQFDPTKNYLWPIPLNEIQKDPNLKQNNGY